MINFIIYEDKKEWQEKYHNIILKIIGKKKDKYHIIRIDKYTPDVKLKLQNLVGKKIYLLDLEVPGKTGLDLAREIRKANDWISPIIIITQYDKFKNEGFTSKVLMLDFLTKDNNLEKKLFETLKIAYHIAIHNKSYNFTYNNEFYQIPLDDILYFEKDLNQNYTNIITKNTMFKIKQSISHIEQELINIPEFYKTHRSCIVNLNNITKISWKCNTIYFKDQQINLISRDKKKSLKDKLTKEFDYDYKYN